MTNCCSCYAHAHEAKLNTGSLFDGSEGNLRERSQVSRKITVFCCGYPPLVQLNVFKVLFSLGS